MSGVALSFERANKREPRLTIAGAVHWLLVLIAYLKVEAEKVIKLIT